MKEQTATLSVLIVNWNTGQLLRACVCALRAESQRLNMPVQVIVVDNGSCDRSAEIVRADFPEVELIALGQNVGFARGNNLAWRQSRGEAVLLLNPDTELQPGCVRALLDALDQGSQIGAVCGRFLNPDGSFQRYYNRLPTFWTALVQRTALRRWADRLGSTRRFLMLDDDFTQPMRIEQPPAACLMIRRTAVNEIGLMDEQFPIFYNDVDLARRLRDAGYEIRYVPEATVVHQKGASLRVAGPWEAELRLSCVRYFAKHHGRAAAAALGMAFAAHLAAAALLELFRGLLVNDVTAFRARALSFLRFLLGRAVVQRG